MSAKDARSMDTVYPHFGITEAAAAVEDAGNLREKHFLKSWLRIGAGSASGIGGLPPDREYPCRIGGPAARAASRLFRPRWFHHQHGGWPCFHAFWLPGARSLGGDSLHDRLALHWWGWSHDRIW